jgi:hypothetical protein
MNEVIIVLSQADKAALGTVRCYPGLQAAEDNDIIWLRGIPAQEKIDMRIRQLPGLHTYKLDEDNNLFPPGGLTPVSKLKPLSWVPLPEFIKVELPVSGLPGKIHQRQSIRLLPSRSVEEGNAILTELDIWKAYAETAPLVRLQQTRFAVAENNKVLVIGTPMVPVPGKAYVLRDTVLLPCGFEFDPPAIAELIVSRLNPLKEAFLLFDVNGNWEKIPTEWLVPATRSAIRLTKGREHG